MALNNSALIKPVNNQVVDPSTGMMRPEWVLFFQDLTGQVNEAVGELSADPAPIGAEYITGAADATLTGERVATDTTTIDADMGTAGQAKWNVKEVPGIAAAGMVARTAAATYTARTLTAGANVTITDGDGVAGNPTIAAATSLMRRSIADITAGDTITTADRGKRVRVLSGTGTLAFQPLATLTDGFFVYIHNAGTGDVTLNPDGAETIDGLTSWVLYPGGVILVQVTGADITSWLIKPMTAVFTASGTLVFPGTGDVFDCEGWGGGGAGAKGAADVAGGGGGGGAYSRRILTRAEITAGGGTGVAVTVATGGASQTTASTNGADGGTSQLATASMLWCPGGIGGRAGATGVGGGGAGCFGVGSAGVGGAPNLAVTASLSNSGFGGGNGGVSGGAGGSSGWGGGGGGGGDAATGGAGGSSVYGGGGGGGGGDTAGGGATGVSVYGGNGGTGATGAANAVAGAARGGGGGGAETGNSGAGGRGEVRIRIS